MSYLTATKQLHYPVAIEHVRELMLVGQADLEFWREYLSVQDLCPFDNGGAAELTISATALRWMGASFRELTVAVAVGMPGDPRTRAGVFLVHAFNSLRAFAWAERTFFHTPYYAGDILVETGIPAQIQLVDGAQTVFLARMSGIGRQAQRAYQLWEGPIFLPRQQTEANDPARLFFARLGGDTAIYPFCPATDTLQMPLSWLAESHFVSVEWRVRDSATHARSKTYRRPMATREMEQAI